MRPTFERVAAIDKGEFKRLSERTLFQSHAWLNFLAETQNAQPVVAALKENSTTLGYFTGLIVQKFGFKILGSPLPGWTTSYMGFALKPGVSRQVAMEALLEFAHLRLGCIHLELMDRHLKPEQGQQLGFEYSMYNGYEIDLTQSEDRLFGNMTSACRRCIRKAHKCGVTIEQAAEAALIGFADDYYAQLEQVFGRQGLVPTYTKKRVQALIRHLQPTGRLLLLRARDPDGRFIATGIFPAMHDRMYFWGGASWRKYQILRPNEAIQWYAMRYWKKRGIAKYDMGGGGSYKSKYGGYEIAVPWFRESRSSLLSQARAIAKKLYRYRQHVRGRMRTVKTVMSV
jgi:hypothetical protein